MGAVLDLFNVLHEPDAVFTRLKERPAIWLPFLVLAILMVGVTVVNQPFQDAAFKGMMAQLPPDRAAQIPASAGGMGVGTFVNPPLFLLLTIAVGAGFLWVMAALTGTEGRYKLLMSVLTHAMVVYVLFAILGSVVLRVRGVESVTSFRDLQAPLGLDLVFRDAGTFLSIYLNGINLFSIWGVWLTGTGVSVTHGVSRGSGITIAAVAYAVGLAGISAMFAFSMSMMGG